MKSIVIHSKGKEELDRAIAYYENQKAGLGLDLLSEVEQATGRIQQNPSIGAPYKIAELRRYGIQRFPFLIFYAEFEDSIWVAAIRRAKLRRIAHAKRRPNYWRNRQLE